MFYPHVVHTRRPTIDSLLIDFSLSLMVYFPCRPHECAARPGGSIYSRCMDRPTRSARRACAWDISRDWPESAIVLFVPPWFFPNYHMLAHCIDSLGYNERNMYIGHVYLCSLHILKLHHVHESRYVVPLLYILFFPLPFPFLPFPVSAHAANPTCAAIPGSVRPRLNRCFYHIPEICARRLDMHVPVDFGACS